MPPIPKIPEIKSPAEYAKDALIAGMRTFEGALTEDQEMWIFVEGIPGDHRVFAIGTDATFVVFYSEDPDQNQSRTYVAALNATVRLAAFAKPAEVEEARRIGFHTPGE